MKIRHKIALIYSLLTSLVLLCAFIIVYYLSAHYNKSDFYNHLFDKALIVAQKYFEEDELNKKTYETIIERYVQKLPQETEIILDAHKRQASLDSLKTVIPENLAIQLLDSTSVVYYKGDKQTVGIYYADNQGDFVILLSAIDEYSIVKQYHLFKVLIWILIISSLLVYLIGLVYANRIVAPIVSIMNNVNKIRATNLSLRLKERKGNDELSKLILMINQMLERLEHSFEMQKEFISNASHELKNPLTAILGETEVALRKSRSEEDYISTLTIIYTEAERLDTLTRNLLSLAQTDYTITNLPQIPIHLNKLIEELYAHFEKTDYKERLNIQIEKKDQYYIINGNNNLLKIAINNLIDNALKFSYGKMVEIKLYIEDNHIILTIKDKGIGIPMNEQNNIFQPFYRASNTRSYKGSGVGLALSDKIIRLHNGSITINSETNEGTEVKVEFKL